MDKYNDCIVDIDTLLNCYSATVLSVWVEIDIVGYPVCITIKLTVAQIVSR